MIIEWSAEAVQALQEKFGGSGAALKLVSDSEGCGCSVSGVPALWAVEAPGQGDLQAASEPFPVWYEPRHAIFFDERMRIAYNQDYRTFTLASDSQIYTNRLAVRDLRE
ncbi:iron-sulfur cluster biosynthesis family protein [Cohnella fermenti]|uniref:Iron-sulfur cluster biosynthesis family protein n=1 Tax=Cohnella fermenti TaxID=2565925 RepID=A0A4S4BJJ3_9BACL|nr:iron-sulfur cluster biosynthesis family protein [Cohnella fermenti]THF74615.1 iron-sulfur cluster biosynthesis family protein [Cohnella fermenti]